MGLFGRKGRAPAAEVTRARSARVTPRADSDDGASGRNRKRIEPRIVSVRPQAAGGFVRRYEAARTDRLFADITLASLSGNATIRPALRVMRAFSRHLAENNDHGREFLRMLKRNVVGPHGFRLQAQAKQTDGTLDADAIARIEDAHAEWSERGICTADGSLSRAEAERLFVESVARDGDVLVRHVRGEAAAGNRFGYALQLIEADQLDEQLNIGFDGAGIGGVPKADGTEIRMGVERNTYGRPVAYHVLSSHPFDDVYLAAGRRHTRVPATEIVHGFIPERIGQARGVPWMYSAIRRLSMLGGYEEAELTAARVAASKMGFFEREPASDEVSADDETADGELIHEVSPGQFEKLPIGVKFNSFDPQHPTQAFGDFVKACLRGAAAGLGVSYNALAKDLEGVNYSSLRQGNLDDRDEWRVLQDWMVSCLERPAFLAWLDMALLTQALPLPVGKFQKFAAHRWQPRGWQWVDPLKEVQAEEKALALFLTTHSEICKARGHDFEELLKQRRADEDLAKRYGFELKAPKPPAPDQTPPAAPLADEEEKPDAEE